MDNKKFEKLMYFLIKYTSKHSFEEFLDDLEITWDEYENIKNELESRYDIKLYQ